MATYVRKQRSEILRQALQKLASDTPIKATGPGSIARSLTEAITDELGDFYDILDFNMTQTVLSTASGRALDLIGELYNVVRRDLTNLAATSAVQGSFYFYIDSVHNANITIPAGTEVYTDPTSYIGRQYRYRTTDPAILPIGTTQVFVGIRPVFGDSVMTAGIDTLTLHNATSPAGVRIRCTNPKAIMPQLGKEEDDSYRKRITKQIRVTQGGTFESVRFRALAIDGVRDAKIREAPYGLGSFEVIITAEDYALSQQVMNEVVLALGKVKPIGVRMRLRQPIVLPFDITANLSIIKRDTTTDELLARRAQTAIITYINRLLPGDELVYNKLIQEIINSSEFIKDVIITRYAPNGREAPRKNYTPNADELITSGTISTTIGS